jgi:hypothetical protein
MKPRNLLVGAGAVLVVATAVYLILKIIVAGVDSPITISDGSIEFRREAGKGKQFHMKSDTEYWVEDAGFQATGVLCDPQSTGCSTVCAADISTCSNGVYPLCNNTLTNCKDNWHLTLNDDGTTINQDGQQSSRFKIKTSAKADSYTGNDAQNPETFKMNNPHLTTATLTLGDDNTALQTLTCQPNTKCQIIIRYHHN